MPAIDVTTSPAAAVALAVQKQEMTGCSDPLIELVGLSAPATAAFWLGAAEELHRRNLHRDAIDFWRRSVSLEHPDRKAGALADMAETMWAVSDFGREPFLTEVALSTLEEIGDWVTLAGRLQSLGRPSAEVVAAVERALEAGQSFEEPVELPEHDIGSWFDLGCFYLDGKDYPNAFNAFAKALRAADEPAALFQIIAGQLHCCAQELGIEFDAVGLVKRDT